MYPGSIIDITGTGFGATLGKVFLVFPALGVISQVLLDGAWTDTVLNDVVIEGDEDFNIPYEDLPATAYFTVLPDGAAAGGVSATFTISANPTPITVFATDTLVFGGPTATVEGDLGPEPAPIDPPLNQPLGRISAFANPGYDIKWYVDNEISFDSEGFDQTDFSIAGPAIQTILANLGIPLPHLGD